MLLRLLCCLPSRRRSRVLVFFFNDTATTEIYTLSLHDALPIYRRAGTGARIPGTAAAAGWRLGDSTGAAGKRDAGCGIRASAATRTYASRISHPVSRSDRKSTRLNSSHDQISYAVFCLKKKIRRGSPSCSRPHEGSSPRCSSAPRAATPDDEDRGVASEFHLASFGRRSRVCGSWSPRILPGDLWTTAEGPRKTRTDGLPSASRCSTIARPLWTASRLARDRHLVGGPRTRAGTKRNGPRTATASPGLPGVPREARARTVPDLARRAFQGDAEMPPRFEPPVLPRASEALPTIQRRRAGWWAARPLKARGLT